ncbi:ABC transporter ATP-binding protein [Candidatus Nitrospira inopinata]|jgi:phospholipid/cholesterol/gamma-HCH transport system ATP-binding protein|uniref:Putative ABC-type transport system, ATP binding component n=1 Tax=Candidatus Nitrospira inopinata TaxID=1715989 RepID=A0A0S4KQJ9_9BACT|nr:ATP-binding cassette domain-containing protein [Candidatus Nitrospira inopinata]CUQ65629.1 putative ABC-type transport system, ATP binding component [Candidatus Nitrospira inopinata]
MPSTAPAGTPVIEVSHVSTKFGKAVVHQDVSLTINQGEVFVIAGGNGCGKSTLLREILGLTTPSSGTIRLFGVDSRQLDVSNGGVIHRRFGVMFQHGALFSSLTLAENVAVPLREHTNLRPKLIREIVEVKIAMVGLPPDSAGKYPNELSGGMRRRAALARAIVMDPELVFLDEPTAGLDPIIAAGFDDLVLSLKTHLGLTVVMVTHDLDSLWQISTRVAVLGDGRVLGVGTMEELSRSDDPIIREYFHGPRGRAAHDQALWNQRKADN